MELGQAVSHERTSRKWESLTRPYWSFFIRRTFSTSAPALGSTLTSLAVNRATSDARRIPKHATAVNAPERSAAVSSRWAPNTAPREGKGPDSLAARSPSASRKPSRKPTASLSVAGVMPHSKCGRRPARVNSGIPPCAATTHRRKRPDNPARRTKTAPQPLPGPGNPAGLTGAQ